eukprot:UN10080
MVLGGFMRAKRAKIFCVCMSVTRCCWGYCHCALDL